MSHLAYPIPAMSTTDSIVALWGGPSILGRTVHAEHELIPLLRKGLPFVALERTMEAFSLSREEVAGILNLPARTLTRRKQTQRLAATESDRLYRFSRILAHAVEALGYAQQSDAVAAPPQSCLERRSPFRSFGYRYRRDPG